MQKKMARIGGCVQVQKCERSKVMRKAWKKDRIEYLGSVKLVKVYEAGSRKNSGGSRIRLE